MTSPVLVQANDLYRYFGQHCAVSSLDLNLHAGEVLGLLGPNGAGKSTTLQMLSGNLAPSAGEIRIDDVDLLEQPKLAKRRIGYLPDRPPLYRDMTVDEYLNYSARLHRIPGAQLKGVVEQAKERCALKDVGRRLIGNLSHGYRQRVGIAQAIVHTPSVVILDEPTTGLDPIQIHEIRSLIRDLAREHSVVFSTHILPEVQAICDRVQIMVDGRTVFDETLTNLDRPQTTTHYYVSFRHELQADDLAMVPGVSQAEPVSGDRWRVSIDPEIGTEGMVAASVTHGWGLRELSPDTPSLEQIFTSLVYKEQAETA